METLTILLVLAAVATVLGAYVVRFRRAAGARIITCPENQNAAGVHLDAKWAAAGRELHLKDCTRWPERKGCDQACLSQIENAPDGCLVRSYVSDWLVGRNCALCGTDLGGLSKWDHRPALMDDERKTTQWQDIAVDRLPEMLEDHQLVCWDCHVVETVFHKYPELPVERVDKDKFATKLRDI